MTTLPAPARIDPGTSLRITIWDEPPDAFGLAPGAADFDRWWTPILGPTSAALYRSLVALASGPLSGPTPTGADGASTIAAGESTVDVPTLAVAIGMDSARGLLAVAKGLERLRRFDLVDVDPPEIAVRLAAPLPSRRLIRRIPESWRTLVAPAGGIPSWSGGRGASPADAGAAPGPPADPVVRAPGRVEAAVVPATLRRSAVALLRRGISPADAYGELARWSAEPDLVRAAVTWAERQPDIRALR